jgi:hypothetical protein
MPSNPKAEFLRILLQNRAVARLRAGAAQVDSLPLGR